KPQALYRVDEIVAIVDDGVTQSTALIDNVGTSLTTLSGTLGKLEAQVTAAATSPLVDTAIAGAIKGAVANLISEPYTDVKNSTAELRGQVNSLGSVLGRLDQAIPFTSLPGTVSNGIEQLDQTLTTADNAIGGLDFLLTSEQTGRRTDRGSRCPASASCRPASKLSTRPSRPCARTSMSSTRRSSRPRTPCTS
ncbi:MAG: hypothetical protein LH650_16855, partial [Chloroflexi bacterium]|nr:hypothetical protein [Chloroflexota bacterium]